MPPHDRRILPFRPPRVHGHRRWGPQPPVGLRAGVGPAEPGVRASGLAEVAALVPYLLGFVPHDSLTSVALHDGMVVMTARVDLADVLDPVAGGPLLAHVFGAGANNGATGVVVVVTSERPDAAPGLVTRLATAADAAGLELLEVGWHRGDRCRSLLCGEPRCCPPQGVVVDRVGPGPVAATVAGLVARPDRAAAVAELDRPPGTDPDALTDAIARAEAAALAQLATGDDTDRVGREAERIIALAREADDAERVGRALPRLADSAAAWCLAALADTAVRDAVWVAVDAERVEGDSWWLDLAWRAPSPYDASPMFLVAWRSWRRGDCVRAAAAAERAQAIPGGYSAARLLLDAIEACVDPGRLPRLTA